MLVLTRVVDQEIIIGDDVVITVVKINGDQVKIGIRAPKHVRVDRMEVRARMDREEPEGGKNP